MSWTSNYETETLAITSADLGLIVWIRPHQAIRVRNLLSPGRILNNLLKRDLVLLMWPALSPVPFTASRTQNNESQITAHLL